MNLESCLVPQDINQTNTVEDLIAEKITYNKHKSAFSSRMPHIREFYTHLHRERGSSNIRAGGGI